MTKREKDNLKMQEVYERFKNRSNEFLLKIVQIKSSNVEPYFKKGLNKVLKERNLKQIE
jgi:hypothetical protein